MVKDYDKYIVCVHVFVCERGKSVERKDWKQNDNKSHSFMHTGRKEVVEHQHCVCVCVWLTGKQKEITHMWNKGKTSTLIDWHFVYSVICVGIALYHSSECGGKQSVFRNNIEKSEKK